MGGKSGEVEAETPMDLVTNTAIGAEVGASKTFEDSTKKADTIDKKKLGTRGLQIPLAADTSTTTEVTPSTTGVQI